MSNNPIHVSALVHHLTEARTALEKRKADLLAEVAVINEALGIQPLSPPEFRKPKAPRTLKAGGIPDAVAIVLAGTPNLTIKQLQEAIPEHAAKSVEATVHAMVKAGKVNKDDQTPRHFSLATVDPGQSVTSVRYPGAAPSNGAARPQPPVNVGK